MGPPDVCQLLVVESTESFDMSAAAEVGAVEVDDDFVCVADRETEVPRLPFELWLSDEQVADAVADDEGQEEEVEEPPFVPLVEVPRDFFVGGSSRELPPFIEFRLPWDGLLLFSFLERLLDDVPLLPLPLLLVVVVLLAVVIAADGDWPEGVGELFTGALRRRPIIVALAIFR